VNIKLTKGDEQFDACRKLAKFLGCDHPEEAAYAIEAFMSSYYQDGETLPMSLSFAKKDYNEMRGE